VIVTILEVTFPPPANVPYGAPTTMMTGPHRVEDPDVAVQGQEQ
jgi:hypothetical protein